VERPAVVGALLQLGNCFDLMDTRCTADLEDAFPSFVAMCEREGWPVPINGGITPDLLLRRRDCAVINFCLENLQRRGDVLYDSVRCGFREGAPVFDGSGIFTKSHVQLAIRNESCILGSFRPRSSLRHLALTGGAFPTQQ
jgi:hypothetical protein